MKKRIVSILLTLAMLVGIMSVLPITIGAASNVWDGSVASSFAGGSGTESDPYQIATGAQLAYLAKSVDDNNAAQANMYYKLTADIYLNDISDYGSWTSSTTGLNQWNPIGTESDGQSGFNGSFNGNGYTIYGLYYSDTASAVGLFSTLNAGTGVTTTVTNLRIVDSYIYTTGNPAGFIAGSARDASAGTISISNIYVEGKITASGNVGGLVGKCGGSIAKVNIDSCVFAGSVTSSAANAGGMLGNMNGKVVAVSNCLNIGDISSSNQYTAGIIGYANKSSSTIKNCINLGTITGSYPREIVVGNSDSNAQICTDCYGVSEGVYEYGLNNKNDNAVSNDLSSVSAITNAKPSDFDLWTIRANDICVPTGVAGFDIKYLTKQFTVKWQIGDDIVETDTVVRGTTPEYNGETPTKEEDDDFTYAFDGWSPEVGAATADVTYVAQFRELSKHTLEGSGTVDSPYEIATAAHLKLMATKINNESETYADKVYKLTDDIVLNDVSAYSSWATTAPANNWTPIGSYDKPFTGTFDGNGKTITGLYCVSDGNKLGLFSCVAGEAVIKDFVLNKAYVGGSDPSSNGKYSAAVVATYNIEKIPANKQITIKNIYVEAQVTGYCDIGGILARVGEENKTAAEGAKVVIDSCVFVGSVTAKQNRAGGIVGQSNNYYFEISNCLNLGNITAKSYAAGIAGRTDGAFKIDNCVNLGTISGGNIREINYNYQEINTELTQTVNNCFGSMDTLELTKNSVLDGTATDSTVYNDIDMYSVMFGTAAALPNATFTKWTLMDNDVALPTGVASFAPAYLNSGETFTVTWVVDDVIVKTTEVGKGQMPGFGDADPTKAEDENYTYTFNGWSPALTPVLGDVTYTAEFFRTRKTVDEPADTTPDTTAPADTAAPADTETPEEKKGCKSAIGAGAFVLVAKLGCGIVLGKKKED